MSANAVLLYQSKTRGNWGNSLSKENEGDFERKDWGKDSKVCCVALPSHVLEVAAFSLMQSTQDVYMDVHWLKIEGCFSQNFCVEGSMMQIF